jgi:sugar (pentulose or hexulose) kinase
MEVISQVSHSTIEINGLYYWDILHVYEGLKQGLKEAFLRAGHIDSIGICTWGVDFGLLDENGYLLANPLCYRNAIGEEQLSGLSADEKRWMFDKTGIQNNRINSLYQLTGIKRIMPGFFDIASHLLMIPDLLNYFFTGEMYTELSIASTTQLLDVRSKSYADDVLDRFGIPQRMLKPLKQHGEVVGMLKQSIAEELRIPVCPVICVPSHDTACAVAAVPAKEEDFLFISSGTWSLIGTELQAPKTSQEVFRHDFTNEGGVFNTITFLKNSAGMHILQCIRRDLELEGKKYTWDEIVRLARSYQEEPALFDPNSYELFNPKNMISAIRLLMEEDAAPIEKVLASTYTSLAFIYRRTIEQIQEITGKDYSSIYIVGGGSQNAYLNQLTADLTDKKVISGPKEATSLGNIGVQLVSHIKGFGLTEIREMIKNSEPILSFNPDPQRDRHLIDDQYRVFTTTLDGE